jgi:pilus assembly protein CpaC
MRRIWVLAWAAVALPAGLIWADERVRELAMTPGDTVVLEHGSAVERVSTSAPEVVDAVVASSREVLLHAKGQGIATVVVWTAGARGIYRARVGPDLEPFRRLLKDTFPEEKIELHAARDAVSLTGSASSQTISDRAAALVAPLGKTVINNLTVPSPGPEKQIVLHVKFAELNRSVSDSFAVNLVSTGAGNTPGRVTTGQYTPPRPDAIGGGSPRFTISDALNVFAFRPDLNLGAFVQALQTRGLLQILAEPNLVATNGKEASFLVGGEFPVPIVQSGTTGAVSVQFREFGIRLSFLPLLTAHGTVRMKVRPEVSTLDLANAVVLSGFTIPALATRKAETDVELGMGQSFVIAGLVDDRVTESLARIPGLSAIPVLGSLFKSRQRTKAKNELLVIVTPEIAKPMADHNDGSLPPAIRELLDTGSPAWDKAKRERR